MTMVDVKTKSMRDIENIGGYLLSQCPNAVLRHRILRDIYRLPAGDGLLTQAKEAVLRSNWVKALTLSTNIHLLEKAIHRAIIIGLDKGDDFLASAADFLVSIVRTQPLHPQRTDETDWATLNIAAYLLSQIDPGNSAMDWLWNCWSSIAQASFSSGKYSSENETLAIHDLLKTDSGTALPGLNSKYVMGILASRSGVLPKMLEELLLNHVWQSQSCMGYQGLNLSAFPLEGGSQETPEAWLSALEVLSGFSLGLIFAEPQVSMLWNIQGDDNLWGLWNTPEWMLSDSWQDDKYRKMDMTARILIYLRRNWNC